MSDERASSEGSHPPAAQARPAATAALPQLETLLPHRPPMRLIDELVAADDKSVRCAATPGTDFVFALPDGTFEPLVLLELMAQTAAVLAGLQARTAGRAPGAGWLVSCRELVLEVRERLALGTRIELEVVERGREGALCSFAGEAHWGERRLARAMFGVMLEEP